MAEMKLRQVKTDEDIAQARELFHEYHAWLGINLCFQNFDKEVAELPGDYVPPGGRLLLADDGQQVAGCIALRKLADGVCEMKRLFVRPEYQGAGLGRILTREIIETARDIGYQSMRLDTLPGKMDRAIEIYRKLGFKEIKPYYESPVEDTLFMELSLRKE